MPTTFRVGCVVLALLGCGILGCGKTSVRTGTENAVIIDDHEVSADGSLTPYAMAVLRGRSDVGSLWVVVRSPAFGDAGLDQLEGLSNVKHLELPRTRVTAAGLLKFKGALPQCEVVRQGEPETKPSKLSKPATSMTSPELGPSTGPG